MCFGKTYTVEVKLTHPDPVPLRPAVVLLEINWTPPLSDGKVEFALRRLSPNGGDIRFDAVDGTTTREFTGNIATQLRIVGTNVSGAQPDVNLDWKADDEDQSPIQLRIARETAVTGEGWTQSAKAGSGGCLAVRSAQ